MKLVKEYRYHKGDAMEQIDEELMITAYHEAGHTITAYKYGFYVENFEVVHRTQNPQLFLQTGVACNWIGGVRINYSKTANERLFANALLKHNNGFVEQSHKCNEFKYFLSKFAVMITSGWYGEMYYKDKYKKEKIDLSANAIDDAQDDKAHLVYAESVRNELYPKRNNLFFEVDSKTYSVLCSNADLLEELANIFYNKHNVSRTEIENIVNKHTIV
jgi:hypothetical protein